MAEPSSMTGKCPTPTDLLLALDGDLPWPQRLFVHAHLWRCPTCREERRETEDMRRVLRRAYTQDELRVLVAPLMRDRLTVTRSSPTPMRVRVRLVGALVFLLVLLFGVGRNAPTLRAADRLLSKAMTNEQQLPPLALQRIAFAFRAAETAGRPSSAGQAPPHWREFRSALSSTSVVVQNVGNTSAPRTPPDISTTLAKLLARYQFHFDPSRPLSVQPFLDWRKSLPQRQDEVTPDIGFERTLKTTTNSGVLRSVELVVRRDDYHPVKQTMLFEGIGRLEIHELSLSLTEPPIIPPPTPTRPATAATVTTTAWHEALEQAELDARLVLHRFQDDLRNGVSLRQTAQGLEVHAIVGDGRDAELRQQLVRVPLIHPVIQAATASAAEINPTDSQLARTEWAMQTFGSKAAADTFDRELRQQVTRVRRYAEAYEQVAKRYESQATRELPPESKASLDQLVQAHHGDLMRDIEEVEGRLSLLLGSETRKRLDEKAGDDWRDQATQAGDAARALDTALEAVRNLDRLSADATVRDASPAIVDLRAAVDRLQKLFEPQARP